MKTKNYLLVAIAICTLGVLLILIANMNEPKINQKVPQVAVERVLNPLDAIRNNESAERERSRIPAFRKAEETMYSLIDEYDKSIEIIQLICVQTQEQRERRDQLIQDCRDRICALKGSKQSYLSDMEDVSEFKDDVSREKRFLKELKNQVKNF